VGGADSELTSGWGSFYHCSAFVLGSLNVVVEELVVGSRLLVSLISFELMFQKFVMGFVFLVAWKGEWWSGMLLSDSCFVKCSGLFQWVCGEFG
jgi:hypothetical protein